MMYYDSIISNYWNKLSENIRCTFVFTCIIGLVTHGTALFNKFSFHDDIGCIFSPGTTFRLGRWMLGFIDRIQDYFFGGQYSLPAINGGLSVLFIAISACFIIELLEVNNVLLSCLTGGLMVSFPVITNYFGYMFTSHYYMLALLLCVMATVLMVKCDRWYTVLLSILMVGSAIGIYQAFIPFQLSLMLIYLIHACLFKRIHLGKLKGLIFRMIYSSFSYMVFYFLMVKFSLYIAKTELSDYQGINNMAQSSMKEYLSRIAIAYKEFFLPTLGSKYDVYPGLIVYMYGFVVLCSVALAFFVLVNLNIDLEKEILIRRIIGFFSFLMIPLSVNFVIVMSGIDHVHDGMQYALVMPFVMFVYLIDKTSAILNYKWSIFFGAVLISIVCFLYMRHDNICYLKATFMQQQCISYYTTLISRIKSCDEYTDEMPVTFIDGGLSQEGYAQIDDKSLGNGTINIYLSEIRTHPYMDINSMVSNYSWYEFMQNWCGYSPKVVDDEDYKYIPEVVAMPCYPDNGSIRVVDNTVVIKFGKQYER